MIETAKKYTIKCSEPGCDNFYNSRGLCRKHYKMLLGREGGYIKDYARRAKKESYKEMKSASDKKYRERMMFLGILQKKQKEYREKWLQNPANREKLKIRHKAYYEETKEMRKEKMVAFSRRHRDELKLKVLTHYSNGKLECANCGIPVYSVLTLDHLDNSGADHKRRLSKVGKASSTKIYKDVIDNNYPPNYQVLCFNCNFHKEFMRRCDVV